MANSKLITYDLIAPGKNYNDLYAYLKSLPGWTRICESVWLTTSTESCVSIRDKLNTLVDSNDRVFVATLTGEAAWHNVLCDNEVLKTNL